MMFRDISLKIRPSSTVSRLLQISHLSRFWVDVRKMWMNQLVANRCLINRVIRRVVATATGKLAQSEPATQVAIHRACQRIATGMSRLAMDNQGLKQVLKLRKSLARNADCGPLPTGLFVRQNCFDPAFRKGDVRC